jgi:hypothetical protein
MTFTTTTTNTFSLTSAKHVASKVVANLRYMQALYGSPSNEWIDKYHEELILFLNAGYLGTVTYGFKRNEKWVAAAKYTADLSGNLTQDDSAGTLPAGADVADLTATSYMTYSRKWDQLTSAERERFKATLPFQRAGAPEPGVEGGYWEADRTYSSDGGGVRRSTLRRYGS